MANLKLDGYEGTSPIGSFPTNGYGLCDMTGNVWEWTSDFFAPHEANGSEKPFCAPRNPRVPSADTSLVGGEGIPRRVIKGARICARRTTACGTDPLPARARQWTRRRPTSASAASFASRRDSYDSGDGESFSP
jgi:hypothetical protein